MTRAASISLAPFFDGSADQRRKTADKVGSAYREQRYFIVRDHGIARDLAVDTRQQALDFFALPMPDKLAQLALEGCGYLPSPGLIGMPQSNVSTNELFLAHRNPDRNPWPPSPAGFGETIAAYNDAAEALSRLLMRVLALASGAPEDHFLAKVGESESFLKIFSFPPPDADGGAGKYRLAEHHDYSAVSLIRCEPHPNGLQVLDASGRWQEAYPDDDGIVILLGEQMTRWSEGRWMPSWHRVENPRDDAVNGGSRTSTCYFFNPGCMADDVEGYLEGRAEFARACSAHLGGSVVERNSWESPARLI